MPKQPSPSGCGVDFPRGPPRLQPSPSSAFTLITDDSSAFISLPSASNQPSISLQSAFQCKASITDGISLPMQGFHQPSISLPMQGFHQPSISLPMQAFHQPSISLPMQGFNQPSISLPMQAFNQPSISLHQPSPSPRASAMIMMTATAQAGESPRGGASLNAH